MTYKAWILIIGLGTPDQFEIPGWQHKKLCEAMGQAITESINRQKKVKLTSACYPTQSASF